MTDEVAAKAAPATIDLHALLREARVTEVLDQLDRELVGLAPVKARIREVAAFLVVSRARKQLDHEGPEIKLAWSHKESGR